MSPSPRASEPVARRTARRELAGRRRPGRRPSSWASARWSGVLGGGDERCRAGRSGAGRRRSAGRGCRRRARRPVAVGVAGAPARRVHGAGGGLDHDRGLVGQVVGHGVELARVGDHAASTSRRRCRSRSRSAGRARGRRRRCARSCRGRPAAQAPQTGSMPRVTQPSTGSSTDPACRRRQVADHLVAGHERERHDRLEVARRRAVDGGQVAAADAGQAGPDLAPSRGRAARAGRCRAAAAGRPWRRRRARPRRRPWRRRSGAGCARTAAPSSPARSAGRRAARSADGPTSRAGRRGGRRSGSERRGAPPGDLVQVLDQPAPLAGQGGQAGLGVDRHGEADGLEHGQVAGGVGVGDRLAQVEAVAAA